ncbi:SE1561 family protein [Terrilactibacillus laevilacticus]|uniref:SE1561 family protein n=1 Tax=Terrilactibacillus laevilacticus TaxID=1380157 RepID=A0ABW5PU83_9BACI|nr:SE1561 family protein [Terrilactibacillus laevilacticus]
MGRASHNKTKQHTYIVSRVKLLLSVVESLDMENAGEQDLKNIKQMLDDLSLKVSTFQDEWK